MEEAALPSSGRDPGEREREENADWGGGQGMLLVEPDGQEGRWGCRSPRKGGKKDGGGRAQHPGPFSSVPGWVSDPPSAAQGSVRALWGKAPLPLLSGLHPSSSGSSHTPHLFFQTFGPRPPAAAHLCVVPVVCLSAVGASSS